MTRYDYDNANPGNLTAITSPRGFIAVSNTYNTDGRVTQQRLPDGAIFQFSYKLLNPTAGIASPVQETTVTDARGNSTVYRFSPNGAWIGVTDPLGQSRSFDRDGNNQIVAIKGNASCAVCGSSGPGDQTLSYDANGNLLTQTDALGNRTSITYEPGFNKVASIRDPLGNVTAFSYDAHGNLLTRTDPNLKKTSFQYDPFGQLIQVTDPLNQKTSITYDSFGNVASLKDPLGNVTSFAHDAIGRLLNVQDALGRTTSTTYDNLNRITRQNDAKNNTTQFAYDPVGNLLSVIDARNNTTSFTYDLMNRLTTRRDPLGRTDTRQYDPNGNLTQFVDRRGQSSSFSYDVLNRLIGEAYQDGSNVSRSYDALSRLVRVDDTAGGVFTFSYDAVGRMTNSTTPFGTVRYQRDGLGRATLRQVIGQPAVNYSYDPAGNLTVAAMPQASVTFAYDARNQVSTISRLNGVVSTLTYDPVSRLSTLTHLKGSTLIDAEVYGYDAVGYRTSHFSSIAQALTTQPVATGSYNGNNEQSLFGSTTNIFDANGNLATTSAPSGTTAYTWDSRNRLKSVAAPGGQTTNFTYDFAGNLIQQVDTGPSLNLSQSFILDELTNVGHVNRSDGDQYSVLAGPSLDQHLAVVRGGGQTDYGLSNGINSTIVTTDELGSIKGRFLYDAFGQTTALNSSFPFQYTGRSPATTGLYYYRARFYSPVMGRFISEDPIGFGSYKYANNSPLKFIDPLGLQGCDSSAGATNFNACNLLVSIANTQDEYSEPARRAFDLGLLVAGFGASGPLGAGLTAYGLITDVGQGKVANSFIDIASTSAGGVPGGILAVAGYLLDNADWLGRWLGAYLTKHVNLNVQICLTPQPF